jgi:uncharacterized protein (TIGR02145 family)
MPYFQILLLKAIFMRLLLTAIGIIISALVLAQAPDLIPYQAIARDGEGHPLVSTSLIGRFSIHDLALDGAVVWSELQTLNTNALGLFTSQMGSSVPLGNVNWANGPKFLQVELDLGNGFVDLGTQQMLSVPYALHTQRITVNVSSVGDTLFVGNGQFVIVPGISEANSTLITVTTVHTCGASGILNADSSYGVLIDQEGNEYKTIVIGTQEWMAENLNTGIYRNGEVIPTGLSNNAWQNTTAGSWSYYDNDSSFSCPNGKLYNWFACADSAQLCPTGWHVPSDADWTTLTDYLGGLNVAGAKMKMVGNLSQGNGLWTSPNLGATNSSGFSGTPAGYRYMLGSSNYIGNGGLYWSSTEFGAVEAQMRFLNYNLASAGRDQYNKHYGFAVRCVKD